MKILTIECPDTVDLTPFNIDAKITFTAGADSAEGILRAKSEASNPKLIVHSHPGTVDIGPPESP